MNNFSTGSPPSQNAPATRLLTADDLTRVARELLSPQEARRYLANELLFKMIVLSGMNGNEVQINKLIKESGALMPDRDIFLHALLSYWARMLQILQARRMVSFSLAGGKKKIASQREGWLSRWEYHYPVVEPCEDEALITQIPLLMGMESWLKNAIGPADIALLPQLVACLDHPEPICQDAAVKMIGAIGTATHAAEPLRPALRALQQRVAEKGCWHRPFVDGTVIAGIIGNNISAWLEMADEITPTCSMSLVEGYCGSFREINAPATALVDRLLAISANIPLKQDEKLCELLTCAAELARKSRYRCGDVRERILPLVNAKSEVLRRAAATALGYVAQLPTDETLLIQLSKDQVDWVRVCAHRAAHYVTTPSSELVEATAQDLNKFDMNDGLPHDDAVETLANWGRQIMPAFEHIRRWLKARAADPFYYEDFQEQELMLIENLGEAACSLVPLLQKYDERITSDQEDDSREDQEDLNGDEEVENIFGENDSDYLQHKAVALKMIRENLQQGIASLRVLDDSDDMLDRDVIAAIKVWEQCTTPVCEKLLQQIEQGEKNTTEDTRTQLEQLANEGQALWEKLIVGSVSKIFGGDELVIGDDEETCARMEALRLSFLREMEVEDVGIPNEDCRDDEFEPRVQLRKLIERLSMQNTDAHPPSM